MSMLSQDTDLDTLAKQLWAIGDPVRLRIGLSQPATSHHLRILRQAGLVAHKKMCRDMFYWIEVDAADGVLGELNDLLAKNR